MENLIDLLHLNEPEILFYLEKRYDKNIIYTYTGPVLIVINPFNNILPDPKCEGILQSFTQKIKQEAVMGSTAMMFRANTEDDMELQSLATQSTEALLGSGHSFSSASRTPGHSILVSGESGSGKTECSKLLLAALINTLNRDGSGGEDSGAAYMQTAANTMQKVMQANAVLESFGNAKTLYTYNSSRYGKFIDLNFNEIGVFVGGMMRTYLIENVRVVNQQRGERSFHIFYQLVAGADAEESALWSLQPITEYHYAMQGRVFQVSFLDDKSDFLKLKSNFVQLGFDPAMVALLFKVIAGLLHLGQIEFVATVEVAGECSKIEQKQHLVEAARLCGFEVDELEHTLTVRTIISPRGEEFKKNLTIAQATNARDAIAKAIYERVFGWIVKDINRIIEPPVGTRVNNISILDIFGFDGFEKNSFEQLVINFANEALQQQFNQHIFKMELLQCEMEQISVAHIEFPDNQDSLDLIGVGIFKVLDDQCRIPNPSDKRFASQMYKEFGGQGSQNTRASITASSMSALPASLPHPKFSANSAQQRDNKFCIQHFAGPVVYSADTFIDKNIDELPNDANMLIHRSSNLILSTSVEKATLIAQQLAAEKAHSSAAVPRRSSIIMNSMQSAAGSAPAASGGSAAAAAAAMVASRRLSVLGAAANAANAANNSANAGGGLTSAPVVSTSTSARNPPSACTQFKNELSLLIKQINYTTPHYIRCIKPIDRQQEDAAQSQKTGSTNAIKFNQARVAEQLRYSGVLEAVRVARFGYNIKLTHYEFYIRYKNIVGSAAKTNFPKKLPPQDYQSETLKGYCRQLIDAIIANHSNVMDANSLQLGLTKIFMKKVDLDQLEVTRMQLVATASMTVQRFCLFRANRSKFIKSKKAILVLQSASRGMLVRKKHRIQRKLTASAAPATEEVEDENSTPTSTSDAVSTPVKGPSPAPVPPTTEKKGPLDDTRGSNYLASKVVEYRKQDDQLLKEINTLISSKKSSDEMSIINFDINNAKKMLKEWSSFSAPGVFQFKLVEVSQTIDYGYKLLKPERLIPMTMSGKVFSFGRHATPEDRAKAAKSANKKVNKDHKVFKPCYNIMEQLRELTTIAEAERDVSGAKVKSKEVEYANASAAIKSDNNKTNLFFMYEQEITKLNRQIHYANKVIEFCRVLNQYYVKYITLFVTEYGLGSAYKNGYPDENAYIIALCMLIEMQKPLLDAEKKGHGSGSGGSSGSGDQNTLFPLTLPNTAEFKMNMICHHSVYFKYMPYLPGIEFSVNSFNILLLGEILMYPIRFIKVMGRSKNNYGQVAFYQASTNFTQLNLSDVLQDPKLVPLVANTGYSAMFITTILTGSSVALPGNVMVKYLTESGQVLTKASDVARAVEDGNPISSVKLLGIHNDVTFSGAVFNKLAKDSKESVEANVLFVMPQVAGPVDSDVRAVLTRSRAVPEEVISSWLRELYLQNKRYESLISSGFTVDDLVRLQLPIKLPPGTVRDIYRKFRAVCDFLATQENPTHQELVESLFPELGEYYQQKQSLLGGDLASTDQVFGDLLAKRGELPGSDVSGYQTIEEVASEFIKGVDFSRFSSDVDNAVCGNIGDNLSFLPTLWLRNINEKQLLIMFSGLMDTMLKSNTEKKDSKKPKLITREIVFLVASSPQLDNIQSLKSCKIVEDIQAVLGMKISFATVDNNGPQGGPH